MNFIDYMSADKSALSATIGLKKEKNTYIRDDLTVGKLLTLVFGMIPYKENSIHKL